MVTMGTSFFGLRWEAQRQAAFILRAPNQSAVVASLCRRSLKTRRLGCCETTSVFWRLI
jgi:hypothetical protein